MNYSSARLQFVDYDFPTYLLGVMGKEEGKENLRKSGCKEECGLGTTHEY